MPLLRSLIYFGRASYENLASLAFINRQLLETYGPCHPGVAQHRLLGFGVANWSDIIHELIRAGCSSDLNIEGWHDPVFKDHPADAKSPLAGK
jgi:sugar phosphate isomerase/epimerase